MNDPAMDRVHTARLADIALAAANPRKSFDYLEELAASMRLYGVLQPLLVRPFPSKRRGSPSYELVSGERRLRAAKIAGLDEVPIVLRKVSDGEARAMRLVENLQRRDLDALEEAEGYRELLDGGHVEDVAALAAKIARSVEYVYKRLTLCKLGPRGRELLRSGELNASTARLVAQIPNRKLSEQAADDIRGLSYRDAQEEMAFYQCKLRGAAGAPFSLSDATLTKAGSCEDCPKRSGNVEGHGADAWVCLDPECFRAKKEALWKRDCEKARKAGQKILKTGHPTSQGIYFNYGGGLAEYGSWIDLDARCPSDPKRRRWRKLLGAAAPKASLVRDRRGKSHVVAKKAEALKVLAKEHDWAKKAPENAPRRNGDSPEQRYQRAHRHRQAAVKATREELLRRAEDFLETKDLSDDVARFGEFLRLIAGWFLRIRYSAREIVAARRGWARGRGYDRAEHYIRKYVDFMAPRELRGLILELIAEDRPAGGSHEPGYGRGWAEVCGLLGIDMAKREKELARLKKAKKTKKGGRS